MANAKKKTRCSARREARTVASASEAGSENNEDDRESREALRAGEQKEGERAGAAFERTRPMDIVIRQAALAEEGHS